jgi:hypothetical protein
MEMVMKMMIIVLWMKVLEEESVGGEEKKWRQDNIMTKITILPSPYHVGDLTDISDGH